MNKFVRKLTLSYSQIQSQSTKFSKISWGDMPPDPPSFSMLIASALHNNSWLIIIHYTKGPHF